MYFDNTRLIEQRARQRAEENEKFARLSSFSAMGRRTPARRELRIPRGRRWAIALVLAYIAILLLF